MSGESDNQAMFSSECPNCREPIPIWRTFFTPVWGRFQCRACGSVLGVDVKRRMLASIPWLAIVLVAVIFLRIMSHGYLIGISLLAVLALVNYGVFERLVVYERRRFCCRRCGYTLEGLPEARCPECGDPFDPAAKAAIEARIADSGIAVRRRGEIVWIVLACLLTISLIVGLLLQSQARAKRVLPPPQPPAATGTAQ